MTSRADRPCSGGCVSQGEAPSLLAAGLIALVLTALLETARVPLLEHRQPDHAGAGPSA